MKQCYSCLIFATVGFVVLLLSQSELLYSFRGRLRNPINILQQFNLNNVTSDEKHQTVLSQQEIRTLAKIYLETKSCWAKSRGDFAKDKDLIPNTVHIVRYGGDALSFTETVCIKSFLVNLAPDRLYFHSDWIDMSSHGEYWNILLNDKNLNLKDRLRVYMARAPEELDIIGKKSVSQATANAYWRFHVLQKYGGISIDTTTFVNSSLESVRSQDATLLTPGGNFSLSAGGGIMAAKTEAVILQKIANTSKNQFSTETEFLEKVNTILNKDLRTTPQSEDNVDGASEIIVNHHTSALINIPSDYFKLNDTEMEAKNDTLSKLMLHVWKL